MNFLLQSYRISTGVYCKIILKIVSWHPKYERGMFTQVVLIHDNDCLHALTAMEHLSTPLD